MENFLQKVFSDKVIFSVSVKGLKIEKLIFHLFFPVKKKIFNQMYLRRYTPS